MHLSAHSLLRRAAEEREEGHSAVGLLGLEHYGAADQDQSGAEDWSVGFHGYRIDSILGLTIRKYELPYPMLAWLSCYSLLEGMNSSLRILYGSTVPHVDVDLIILITLLTNASTPVPVSVTLDNLIPLLNVHSSYWLINWFPLFPGQQYKCDLFYHNKLKCYLAYQTVCY